MKKQKKPPRDTESEFQDSGPLDWIRLYQAFDEATDWALDVAVQIAHDYPDEVEAVERVRSFLRRRIAGIPAHVRIDDVMFVFGLIIGAIERDLGPTRNLAPWFAAPMRCPGRFEDWEPRWMRNAANASPYSRTTA